MSTILRKAISMHSGLPQGIYDHVHLSIKEEAISWGHGSAAPLRKQWPSIPLIESELVGFGEWLRTTRAAWPAQVKVHVTSARRLLSLLVVPPGCLPESLEVVTAMQTGGATERLMALPLLALTNSWTKKVATGFKLYVLYMNDRAGKSHKLSIMPILRTHIDMLALWGKQLAAASSQATRARGEYDCKRMDHLPSVPEMKAACHEAMKILQSLGHKYAGATAMDPKDEDISLYCMAGILHTSTYAGRCHEWVRLLRKTLCNAIANRENFIVCTCHKTATCYGDIAKYIPDGLLDAFQCFLALPLTMRCSGAVFCTRGSANVCMYRLLKFFSAHFFPGKQMLTTNLVRKMFRRYFANLDERSDVLYSVFEIMGENSIKTNKKVYGYKRASDDAVYGQLAYKCVFGDEVPWPGYFEAGLADGVLVVAYGRSGQFTPGDGDISGTSDSESEDNEFPRSTFCVVPQEVKYADGGGSKLLALTAQPHPTGLLHPGDTDTAMVEYDAMAMSPVGSSQDSIHIGIDRAITRCHDSAGLPGPTELGTDEPVAQPIMEAAMHHKRQQRAYDEHYLRWSDAGSCGKSVAVCSAPAGHQWRAPAEPMGGGEYSYLGVPLVCPNAQGCNHRGRRGCFDAKNKASNVGPLCAPSGQRA